MRCNLAGRTLLFALPIALFGLVALPAFSPVADAAVRTDARGADAAARDSGPVAVTDSMYAANHPRLLFNAGEIPELYAKVRDGGADDTAYSFIRVLIQYIYPGSTFEELLDGVFALTTIPNLGVGSVLQSPPDLAARDRGRDLTLYIATQYDCGDDNFESALRLRALALGYDMFFAASTVPQRAYAVEEILSYMNMMLDDPEYAVWSHRPYLANVSAMIASSLGLAAICLDGEVDPALVEAALARADHLIGEWMTYQIDEDGAYNEGAAYGSWSMSHLIYYFWARVRYDGFDYAANGKFRNMEKWFAYELLPSGGGAANNIQDCSTSSLPLPRNSTYFDWAQTVYGSRLSAYIWEHTAGTYGYNAGTEADKAGTVIWHRNLSPQAPEDVLPPSMLWEKRGLYYYRSGWPAGANSGDILFSFYSGRFQGGHAQEDQNQFTLYAYGAPFVIDHGPGTTPKQSEAHNMILIDGKGQHNAGSSIGTDGDIHRYLINDFSDYVVGDAKKAYATHSPVNNLAFPFPYSDWSWGYEGANPVERAYRSFFVVRDPETPPYFILIDDMKKDSLPHAYEWRLHTGRNNAIDTSTNPINIALGGATLRAHVVSPPFSSLAKSVSYFNNLVPEADSNVLSLGVTTADPLFVMVLVPGDGVVATPVVTGAEETWGFSVEIAWPGGKTDVLLVNRSGAPVAHVPRGVPVETDAQFALLRFDGSTVEKYVLVDAGAFAADGTDLVTISGGRATVGFSGSEIDIDRHDADFRIYAPGVSDMFYRGQRITVSESDGYLTRHTVTGLTGETPPAGLRVRAYPNPFNPTTTISLDVEEAAFVSAALYDASGRRVRTLWNAPLPEGRHTLTWDGENDAGEPAASGVYFLTVTSAARSATTKIVLIR